MPKTALLHYWLTNMRGGENVVAEFCRIFPDADIFTHAWNPDKVKEPFDAHKITETFIGRFQSPNVFFLGFAFAIQHTADFISRSRYRQRVATQQAVMFGILESLQQ